MTPWRRVWVVVGMLGLAAGVLGAALPPRPTVLVLGDSYASGEGLREAEGTCGTERDRSWGALVAQGFDATDLQLLACSGAQVADVTVGGPLRRPPQLEEAVPADLVLLTLGGNDLGFTGIVADCLGFAELEQAPDVTQAGGWTDLVEEGAADGGCDVTDDELDQRVAALADGGRFRLPQGGTGSMADAYAAVAEGAVAEGGLLVVVGYPALFADPDAWPARYGRRCHGVRATDVARLNAVVGALDEVLSAAAADADRALGGGVVRYVSLVAAGAGHGLCGSDDPWVNGLTVAEGGVDVAQLLAQLGVGPAGLDLERLGARPSGSFHPGTAGHRGIADTVIDALADG